MIRVIVADDHYLVREGTRQLLESSREIEVLATVEDGTQLLDAVGSREPDAVVVDIRMPPNHQMEGIEAAHHIRAIYPGVGVVVLSQHANSMYAFELFKEGTAGLAYLLKDRVGDLDVLVTAVRQVVSGGSVIDPIVVEEMMALPKIVPKRLLDKLTDREVEVLRAMAEGRSNQAIADELFISSSAVEKHISSIFVKLGLPPGDADTHRRVAAVLAFLYSPG